MVEGGASGVRGFHIRGSPGRGVTRQDAARKRLASLRGFSELHVSAEVERLASVYLEEIGLPMDAARDALHIALASVWSMDFLATWNCRHIANGHIRRRVRQINQREGFSTPTICTPEELLDDAQR